MRRMTDAIGHRMLTVALLAPLFSSVAVAQSSLTVGTRNEFDFDFDGVPLETEGDLGATMVSATLSGIDVPAALQSQGVLSVTLDALATGGNVSADQGNFVEARGIGVASPMDSTRALTSNLNDGESLTLTVASTGIEQAMLFGLDLSGTRGSFPFTEVTLTGATVNGASVLNTETSLEDFEALAFDSPVDSVTITSTGDDGFRIAGVYLGAVPEPGSLLLLIGAGCPLLGHRSGRCEHERP